MGQLFVEEFPVVKALFFEMLDDYLNQACGNNTILQFLCDIIESGGLLGVWRGVVPSFNNRHCGLTRLSNWDFIRVCGGPWGQTTRWKLSTCLSTQTRPGTSWTRSRALQTPRASCPACWKVPAQRQCRVLTDGVSLCGVVHRAAMVLLLRNSTLVFVCLFVCLFVLLLHSFKLQQ